MTNAEAIARILAVSDTEMIFGLPGGEVAALLEACRKEGLRFYLTGHEASAAFMAEVSGQITGRAGVCVSTLGPGAMNLCLGVANAFLDRSPMLAITAELPTRKASHFPHQRLPLEKVFQNITKLSVTLDGRRTDSTVHHCLELAATPRFGPVHLALPSDLATESAEMSSLPVTETKHAPPSTPAAQVLLDEASRMLSKASRSLMIVGLGCRPEDVPALRAFVARMRIPFAVTPKAKGTLPETADGFVGVVGGMALDKVILETLQVADVLLGVGFDPVECDKDWYIDRQIINVDRSPTAESRYQPLEVLGDIGSSLVQLSTRIEGTLEWPKELLADRKAAIQPRARVTAHEPKLSPLAAINALRDVLPRETILTCDVGAHKYYVGQFWQCFEPNTLFVSNGLSGMGYGVPAAIAAKLQLPHRPVVSVVGDGGMLMMLHNLVFIRQYSLPVVIIVFVDESLSLIRVSQERRGYRPTGVDFPAPDFAQTAKGFGIEGVVVRSIDELKMSVDRAVRTGQPALIHTPVDSAEYGEFV